MAGGNFDVLAGKERPGTYINFESTRQDILGISERGVVLLPLAEHSYGPAKRFITLTNDAPDAMLPLLGYRVYDNHPNMLLIREAFKNAHTVIVYIPQQGAAATATVGESSLLKATARYGGSRGNALQFSVTENPLAGFDVTIYLDAVAVAQYEKLSTVEELIALEDPWIEFSGTGALPAIAGTILAGGTDGSLAISDMTEFFDKSEAIKWNTLAFPLEATGEAGDPVASLHEALRSKIKYLREDVGKYRKAVCANYDADYEGIVNVTNGVVVNGMQLSAAQATAWVAGADAGASNTQSNTYVKYNGATDIVGLKTHAESVAAIRNGEFFFSFSEEGDVIVEYDINSLTTFAKPKDQTYRKNRVLRVLDTFGESLMLNFPPNKFANSPVGWDIMEGLGRAIMRQFSDAGAIKNVDYYNDFAVDRAKSTGDTTFFNLGLEPVDSAEKLFFTIRTR